MSQVPVALFAALVLLSACSSVEERQQKALLLYDSITHSASGGVKTAVEGLGEAMDLGASVVGEIKEGAATVKGRVEKVQQGVEMVQEGKALIEEGIGR